MGEAIMFIARAPQKRELGLTRQLHLSSLPQNRQVDWRSIVCAIFALCLSASLPASAQDATAGQRVFTQCGTCHQVGPTARSITAPVLNDIFGRVAGSVEGYRYSEAMKGSGITWDEETFRTYIKDPQALVPGSMMFFKLEDEKRIDDLIAFLKQY
jgi:cytochrome c